MGLRVIGGGAAGAADESDAAARKGVGGNAAHAVGNHHVLQIRTACEGARADGGRSVGDHHRPCSDAQKGLRVDHIQGIGQVGHAVAVDLV